MRPTPTIPNCMCIAPVAPAARRLSRGRSALAFETTELSESFLNRRLQSRKPRLQIASEVNPQCAPSSIRQDLKISPRLRRLHHPETVFLSRHRQFHGIIASNL